MEREELEWFIPHSDFGDPECCGFLLPVEAGAFAELTCNECGVVTQSIPRAEVRQTLDKMELSLSVASEICPHCHKANLFPGFDRMLAFTCRECGAAVNVAGGAYAE